MRKERLADCSERVGFTSEPQMQWVNLMDSRSKPRRDAAKRDGRWCLAPRLSPLLGPDRPSRGSFWCR